MFSNLKPAKITFIYALFGAAWILLSDRALHWFMQGTEVAAWAQTLKGLGFIALTATLVFFLVRRAQNDILRSQTWNRELFDTMPDAIFVVGAEGRFMDANAAAVERYGYTREELLTMGPDDLAAPELRDQVQTRVQQASQGTGRFEWRHCRRNGQTIDVEIATRAIRLPSGETAILCCVRDITAYRAAQATLKRQAYWQQALVQASPLAIIALSPEGNVLSWNAAAERLFGWTADEILGRPYPIVCEDRQDEYLSILRRVLAGDPVSEVETERHDKEGKAIAVSLSTAPIRDETGQISGVMTVIADITARKQAEAQLRASESRYRSLFENNHAVMLLIDPVSGQIVDANPAATRFYGWPRETLQQMEIDVINTLPADQVQAEMALAQAEERNHFNFRHHCADGKDHDVEVFSGPIQIAGRSLLYSLVFDVTRRRQAEEALRESEERFRRAVESAPDAIFIQTGGRFAYLNQAALTLFGAKSPEDLIGASVIEQFHPDFREIVRSRIARLNTERSSVPRIEETILRLDGTPVEVEVSAVPFRFQSNDGALVFVRDITERKESAMALLASEARYRKMVERSPELICVVAQGRVTYANPAFLEAMGVACMDALANTDIAGHVHPNHRAPFLAWLDAIPADGASKALITCQLVRPDGETLEVEAAAAAFVLDQAPAIQIMLRDITVQRRLQAQKDDLEDQLRQAQKMEAIGQLAGGVAHDFNNLLQVINGYTDLTFDSLPEDHADREMLVEVQKAGKRAAVLVGQLLAFSRRQVMRLETLDLNEVVADLMKMLSRVIGADIRLDFVAARHLPHIQADRGMMEQVLMNLCVNSRDAMPDGGTLTIETHNVLINGDYCATHAEARPGRFALLCVTDTGSGMDEETRERIFEPFFTTKVEGRGTGLGLATVYGIVRQHEGLVQVYSEPGKGTMFKIYLPVSEARASHVERRIDGPVAGGRDETVLLAEDDAMVRQLGEKILKMAGYEVLVAGDGAEAVALYQVHADRIALLVLDVVMPTMGGKEAFDRIRALGGQAPVLFASGYSENAVHTHFVLKEGVQLIQKPFSREVLLRAVRKAIDGKA